ncbi:hypothetical protein CAOG_06447 [Capsaspora owczarzaki ATCC 30864]|uniref:Uncharacterized protein n=1 Tax=Capsaspora owczarzaki (strain ATCC 30864) TaxID=595528 RepID=A0A0D2WU26_CAPO3|nr:hypothetical protein CAOG_06447 [Capsaspora owczarzaki ATCC 30864]KJE96075.1 hypothetical protein CAOG_006447 [Capsaspora owczarzaki ATCC 30864]|eukprot:XP_004345196.1 hypothetical protein CAOG_06447 [Capsaspora owczarzaki ATCC 30864]
MVCHTTETVLEIVYCFAAAAAAFVFGGMYHGHPFIHESFMRESKLQPSPHTKWPLIIEYLTALVKFVALNLLATELGVTSIAGKLSLAAALWFAFDFLPTAAEYVWAGRSFVLLAIHGVYHLSYLFVGLYTVKSLEYASKHLLHV